MADRNGARGAALRMLAKPAERGGRALVGWLRRLFLPGRSAAENTLFLTLILVGAAVRLLWLGEVPQGLNQDEASLGYDHWALLEHGIDRHGHRYPVHHVSWGSGQNALYGYLSMPFIKLLGLNVLSIRLAQAILGVASLFVMYAVGARLVDRGFALCALFVLAISPWHVMMSRWGLESCLLPTVLLFAFALLLRGLRNPHWMIAAFPTLGLALYAYGPAYVFVPLFTLGVLAYGVKRRLADLRHWGLGLALMAVVALPIGLFLLINLLGLPAIETQLLSIPRYSGVPRWQQAAAFFTDDPIGQIAQNAWRAFEILVMEGHDDNAFFALPAFGYFYNLGGLGVTLAGAGFLLRDLARGGRRQCLLVLLWLATGLLVSAMSYPNIVRMNHLYLPLLLCAAYGLHRTFPHIRAWRRHSQRTTTNILCVASLVYLTLSFAAFTRHYFLDWGSEYSFRGHPSYAEALAHVIRHADPDATIYLPRHVHYTIPLFLDPPDPALYLKTVEFTAINVPFQKPRSYGRYRFGFDAQAAASGSAFVIRNRRLPNFPTSDFIVTKFDQYSALLRQEAGASCANCASRDGMPGS